MGQISRRLNPLKYPLARALLTIWCTASKGCWDKLISFTFQKQIYYFQASNLTDLDNFV